MPKGISAGEAKGPGNGSPKAKPFNGETPEAKAGREKGFLRRKMAAYRAAHPDAPPSASEQARQIDEILKCGEIDAIETVYDAMTSPEVPLDKRAVVANSWIDRTRGKAKQAVELTGQMDVGIKGYAVTPDVAATMEQWTELATQTLNDQSEIE